MRCVRAAIVATGLAALAGCAPNPVNEAVPPKASVTVVSLDGKAVEGAVVTLVSQAYPNQYEKFRTDATTDRDGVAEFPRIRKWKVESLGLGAADAFMWNWCVRRDGYATVATFDRSSADFERHATFTLLPGESTPCPAGP
jgi:hypothetical protein